MAHMIEADGDTFVGIHFDSAHFRGLALRGCVFVDCRFSACSFLSSMFVSCCFRGCIFLGGTLSHSNWQDCRLVSSRFEQCSMLGVQMDCFCEQVVMSRVVLSKSSLGLEVVGLKLEAPTYVEDEFDRLRGLKKQEDE